MIEWAADNFVSLLIATLCINLLCLFATFFTLANQYKRNFRIAPEPKVIWVNEYANGEAHVHDSQNYAKLNAAKNAVRIAVRYVEQPE